MFFTSMDWRSRVLSTVIPLLCWTVQIASYRHEYNFMTKLFISVYLKACSFWELSFPDAPILSP